MSNEKLLAMAEAYSPPQTDLARVEEAAEQYRDLVARKAELEEELRKASREVEKMASETIPDLMDTVGIDHVGVPARGNHAGFEVLVRPYYKAVIAAGWDDERKERAFAALSAHQAGDLIKRMVVAYIPAGLPNAQYVEDRLIGMLDKIGLEYEVSKTVPWGTLTAWVKDRSKKQKPLPPLDDIGATIGRKAEIRERKE